MAWEEDSSTRPFPVDEVRMESYIVDSASKLSVETIASYSSALKRCQPMYTGVPWALDGNDMVR